MHQMLRNRVTLLITAKLSGQAQRGAVLPEPARQMLI